MNLTHLGAFAASSLESVKCGRCITPGCMIRLQLLNALASSTDEAKADKILRHFSRAFHLTEEERSQPPLSNAAADAGLIAQQMMA
jgi:hypothetical protein